MKLLTPFKVLILLVVLLSACREPVPSVSTVRIGLIAYTEDEHSESMGVPTVNAARLAVDRVKKDGGIQLGDRRVPVELVIEGISSSPQNAVAAFRKLTNRENVAAVVGLHYSIDAIPAGAFADKARVPFISPMSTNSLTTRDRNYVFRMSFVDELQGSAMARHAYSGLGFRRPAILFNRTDPYSSGIAEVFAATFADAGGRVVARIPYIRDAVDYDQVASSVTEANADVLYLPGFAVDVYRHVQALRVRGVDISLLGADGWDADVFSRDPAFAGSLMTTHWFRGVELADGNDFTSLYRRSFNADPEAVAALTYDAMNILFKAVEHAGSVDGDAIRSSLLSMEAYDGVAGQVDFTESGDPVKGVFILRFEEGEVVLEKIVQHGEGG